MPSPTLITRFFLVAAAFLAPGAAYAHVGAGDTHSFSYGFMHPIGGLDHILAMVAVGMLAANLGGRALWAVPLSFVAAMAFGGYLGVLAAEVPFVELGIALSVIVFGLAIASNVRLPIVIAMALVGVFAIFHGHAHGEEMPGDASGAAYAIGFMLATALLHIGGIALGVGIQQIGAAHWSRAARISGVGLSLAGAAILTGAL